VARFSQMINFGGGEVSPESFARNELESYKDFCELMLNAYVPSKKGARRRNGSVFINDEANFVGAVGANDALWINEFTNGDVRLFPFIISKTEAYVLAIGQKSNGTAPTYPKQFFNVEFPTTFTGLETSDLIYSEERGCFQGFRSSDDVYQAQYTQAGGVLVICHPKRPPALFVRRAENDFIQMSLRDLVNTTSLTTTSNVYESAEIVSIPYRDVFADPRYTVTMSIDNAAIGAGRTLTASTDDGWGGFQSGHVGAFFRTTVSGQVGVCTVTDVVSSTVAEVTVLAAFGGTGTTSNWQESSWSDYRGWPRSVAYFQNRLHFGGNEAQPATIWSSQAGDIGQFGVDSDYVGASWSGTGSASASDAFQSTITTGEIGLIQWMSAGKSLSIGTESREHLATIVAGSNASSLSFETQSAAGSQHVQARPFGSTTLFVDRSGLNLREFVFNFDEDNYRAENLSENADHMPKLRAAHEEFCTVTRDTKPIADDVDQPEIVELQVQQAGAQMVWARDNYGGLFSLSRNRNTGLLAWSRFETGHATTDLNAWQKQACPTEVVSMCVVPNKFGTVDDLWLAVRRNIDGADALYIERISGQEYFWDSSFVYSSDDYQQMVFLDSAKVSLVNDTTITGLDHLEGETVRAVGDGADLGDFVVSGGEIEIPAAKGVVVVGIPFMSVIQPLFPEVGSIFGNAQGSVQKIDEITLRLYKSHGLQMTVARSGRTIQMDTSGGDAPNAKIGLYYESLMPIDFLPGDLTGENVIPFFTGDKILPGQGDYSRNDRMVFYSVAPFPFQISGAIIKGITYDS
jgi:hypothetical protein